MVVGETLAGLALIVLGEVIHLRSPTIVTDREIVLGAMTGTAGALASRLATRFVALDERTPQETIEGWPVAQ
jgi:DNA/RNA endonuclease YhcR with UshA esterase domain